MTAGKDISSLPSILVDLFQIKVWNMLKLITKEDYLHLHKCLGLLSLSHYMYRAYLLAAFGSMQFDGSYFTLGCIALHMLLSGTSFLFHISGVRNPHSPMIYPEFRLHSVIFAYRSLIVMVLQWFSMRFEVVFPLYFRSAIVIVTMLAADHVTRIYKDQGTTMRGMPFPEYVSESLRRHLNLFYSVSQIFATGEVIFANHMDEVFAVVFPIQIAAFLMTCVRKSIISAGAWHNFYALSLLSNYVIAPYVERTSASPVPGGFFFPTVFSAIILRFYSRVNKYAVWFTVGCAHLFAMFVLGRYTVLSK